MASSVATPLEQQFAALPGLAEMTSTSGVGSTTSITLQFDLDRSIDAAAQRRAAGDQRGERQLLPKDLPNPPIYRKTNPADRADPDLCRSIPIRCRCYNVDDYAYTIIAQKVATVKGVSQVPLAGQKPYAVHVAGQPGGAGGARHRPRGGAPGAGQRRPSTGQG